MAILYNDDICYGIMGEYTGYKNYHIGDVLKVKDKEDDSIGRVMVVYDYKNKRYSALGLLFWDIEDVENDYIADKIISWEDIDDGNINNVTWTNGYKLV